MRNIIFILLSLILLSSFIYAIDTDIYVGYNSFDTPYVNASNFYGMSSTLLLNITNDNNVGYNQAGKLNQSIYCDGSETANIDNYMIPDKTSSRYYYFWFKSDNPAGGAQNMVMIENPTEGTMMMGHGPTTATPNVITCTMTDNTGGAGQWSRVNSAFTDTTDWHLLVCGWNTTHIMQYVDGSFTSSIAETVMSARQTGNSAICDNGGGVNRYSGGLDEFGVIHEELTPTEVQTVVDEIWNSGDGYNPFYAAPPTPTNNTCSCPGLNNDWEVNGGDMCNITVACDIGTGILNVNGTGRLYTEATIDAAYFKVNGTTNSYILVNKTAGGLLNRG